MSLVTLRTRRDLSRSLHELSQRQAASLASRDYDTLIEVLSQKRTLLDRLATLSLTTREWLDQRGHVGPAEREEGEALIAEANRILAEVNDAEKLSVDELTRQRDRTRDELLEINAAGRVHSAYRDALAPVTRRSLDVDR